MLSDREIARHGFRVALFTRRGVEPQQAEHLADGLIERDADLDERRYCLECKHLQRSGGCFAASQGWVPGVDRQRFAPVRDILVRCPHFNWVTP